MKKDNTPLLLAVTALFAVFLVGFYLGRNTVPRSAGVYKLSEATTEAQQEDITAIQQGNNTPQQGNSSLQQGITAVQEESNTIQQGNDGAQQEKDNMQPQTAALLNINTATKAQLVELPGIGNVLADRIIAYREENGPFRSISQLTDVSGIGQARLVAIMEYITVEENYENSDR